MVVVAAATRVWVLVLVLVLVEDDDDDLNHSRRRGSTAAGRRLQLSDVVVKLHEPARAMLDEPRRCWFVELGDGIQRSPDTLQ
ncbi:hypothetical protein LWI28_024553 [Acer negundo]|uniref:Secreted protein n=1 Tax=Acer negundo TaxID=4023 RepID=A0AAD5IS87_ACENE|nr:hypothetical protein LWI28_024553 [Acer negundo]